LWVWPSTGQNRARGLYPWSVADVYEESMASLRSVGPDGRINQLPQEVASPICGEYDFERVANDTDAVVTETHRSIQRCT